MPEQGPVKQSEDLSRRSLLNRSAVSLAGFLVCATAKSSNAGPLAHWEFQNEDTLPEDVVTGLRDSIYSRQRQLTVGRGLSNSALRLDGYSTWLAREASQAPKLGSEFTIELCTALESYPNSEAAFVNQRNGEIAGYFFGIDQFGFLHLQVSINGIWRECASKVPIPRFQWTHLAATLDRSGSIVLYRDGVRVGSSEGAAGKPLLAGDVDLLVGKTNSCPYIAKVFPTGVLNCLLDDLAIHDRCVLEAEISHIAGRIAQTAQPDLALSIEGDPHRPVYHALPLRAWTNEPHGLIHFGGEYHLFFQKNADGPYWGQINWGHLTSPDLLRWTERRPALSPAPGLDAAGCWSGSVVRRADELAIIYTAGDGHKPSICLATSKDGFAFSKSEHNPIIPASPGELNHPDFRDPFVWREGETFYLLIGSGIPEVGGTALLYKSPDLLHWTFLRKLLQGTKDDSGTFWEMPVFIPLGRKHILIVCEVPGRASYWIGDWKDEQFYPDQRAPQRLEIINHFLSPTPHLDPQGDPIMIGIIPDTRHPSEAWKAGWSHCYSVPRVLSLDERGALCQNPLPKLERLRRKHFQMPAQRIAPEQVASLTELRGDSLEIRATFSPGTAARTGLRLRRSDDGQEETILYYDWAKRTITVDRTQSSLNTHVARTVNTGPFELRPGESLQLHVLLDHSVLEVFVNGRGTLTSRIYPTRHDSDGIALFCDGPAELSDLEIWQMEKA